MPALATILRCALLPVLLSPMACGRGEGELLRRLARDAGLPPPLDADQVDGGLPPPLDATIPKLDCVERINSLRASVGLSPYLDHAEQAICVYNQARIDAERGWRFQAYGMCGESSAIECGGYYGAPKDVLALCLQQSWEAGPGSAPRDAITGSHAAVECGAFETTDGHTWLLIDFFDYSP